MSVTFATGFEAQALSVDNITLSGTAAYSTAQARTGVASIRCNPGSGLSGNLAKNFGSPGYRHFGMYIASMPSVTRNIAGTGTGTANTNLNLRSDGTLEYKPAGVVIGSGVVSASALTTGVWYWIGIRELVGSDVPTVQVDGATVITANASDGEFDFVGPMGTEASAIDLYFDDLILYSSDFLAPSKVDIALPISDNTVTGVTDGNGGTSNLWQCVNNTPPAGVASGSEPTNPAVNIRFPASTTENYIANLETYTTLGILTGDTVLAVYTVVRHGEDISTGIKLFQNCGTLTNPTITVLGNTTFGTDGGAHAAETGVWVSTFGGMVQTPTVTLGTSPTIRSSRISESRVGCIDFMGLVVAWTPAAVARVPRFSPYPQLLAH